MRLLFFLFPLAEIFSLWWAATHVGFWYVVLSVVAGFVLGMGLLQSAGRGFLADLQRAAQMGQQPTQPMQKTLLTLLAAGLLIVPGFVSDFLALLLLFAPTRFVLQKLLQGWLWKMAQNQSFRFVRFETHSTGMRDVYEADPESQPRVIDVTPLVKGGRPPDGGT